MKFETPSSFLTSRNGNKEIREESCAISRSQVTMEMNTSERPGIEITPAGYTRMTKIGNAIK